MKLHLQSCGYGQIWAVVEQAEEIRSAIVADGEGAVLFAHGQRGHEQGSNRRARRASQRGRRWPRASRRGRRWLPERERTGAADGWKETERERERGTPAVDILG